MSSVGSPLSYTVPVSQDYGASGALRPSYPNLSSFVLYAFLSSDWCVGNTDPAYARGAYQLDSTGDWLLNLLPGTYNLVLMNGSGTVIVYQFNLVITVGTLPTQTSSSGGSSGSTSTSSVNVFFGSGNPNGTTVAGITGTLIAGSEGDMYFDTDASDFVGYAYHGSSWNPIA